MVIDIVIFSLNSFFLSFLLISTSVHILCGHFVWEGYFILSRIKFICSKYYLYYYFIGNVVR